MAWAEMTIHSLSPIILLRIIMVPSATFIGYRRSELERRTIKKENKMDKNNGCLSISGIIRNVIRILILCLILNLSGARSQNNVGVKIKPVEWPDTYAGQWAEAFFEAYNTDGTDALRQFIKKYYSEEYLKETPLEEELNAGPLTIRNMVGKITIHSVEANGDYIIEAIARTDNVGWVKYKIELSKEPPHDLIGMGPYAQADPPEEIASNQDTLSSATSEDYTEWDNLHELLQRICSEAGIPGLAAAIIQNGKIVDIATVGTRRLDVNDSIQIGDRFQIGSVTKVLTGAMLGKLVKAGTLHWDMTIGNVLKDIPMRDEYRNVTLGQLLQFRGGLPNYPSGGEFEEVMSFTFKSEMTPAEGRKAHVHQVLTEEPLGGPDEERYSSSAYVVAGYMAEWVTGRSWEQLMRNLIFEPLEMQSADFGWPATFDNPNQPMGHYGTPPDIIIQEIEYDPFGVHTYAGPAGDINCSIGDLARFATFQLGVLNGRDSTLNAESVGRYWKAAETKEPQYGFYGSGGTFLAMIMLYPDSDLGIVAAANHGLYAMPFLEKLRDAIHQHMLLLPKTFR